MPRGKPKGRSEKGNFQPEMYRALMTLKGHKWYHNIVDLGYRNPFDAMLVYKGVSYGLEYKISKKKRVINLYELFKNREHELIELERHRKAGGRSYVLINVFNPRKWNYVIIIRSDDYLQLRKDIEPSQNINLDDPILKRFPRMGKINVGDRYTDNRWDLNTLIDYE